MGQGGGRGAEDPGGAEPASGSAGPAASGAEPVSGGAGPVSSSAEPASSGAGPAASGAEPASGGAGPAASGAEPASSGAGPVSSSAGPASGGAGPLGVSGALLPIAPPTIEHFIGRRAHLRALHRAAESLFVEKPVSVLVHGGAGMGKSALVHHFLMGLRRDKGPVVLRGRCALGASESYNAFGGLMESLSRYLRRLPEGEAARLLPRDVRALARVFPALARVPAVASAPRVSEAPDAQELRRRSFAALRQLLWRIAERRPLIVAIEDLQWSDIDSAALLLELTRPPDAPAMMFLGSYRTEDVAASAPLRALLDGVGLERHAAGEGEGAPGAPDGVERQHRDGALREIVVGPLSPIEAEELALALLSARDELARDEGTRAPGRDEGTRARADAIARASGGDPRLLAELARDAQDPPGEGEAQGDAARGRARGARLHRLPEQARRLLEVIAVAGEPIDAAVAARAAGIEAEERAPALALLLTEDLIAARRDGEAELVEVSHDLVRASVLGRLVREQLAARHRRLALALEALGAADAETLSRHWLGAGDAARAGRLAARAAEQAAEALAFERAARLYERALGLLSGDAGLPEAERRALEVRCADALVDAGEGAAAARIYAAAAEGAESGLGLELRRRAAEQYLRSGHIDEGLELVRAVLRAVGLSLPETPRRALVSLLLHRAELRLRGLRFRERPEREVRPEDIARIDACWTVTVGLSGVDMVRAAEFSARALLLALRAGEPYRIGRALAFEASSACMMGSPNRARAEELVSAVRALAERLDSPHLLGLSMMVSGMLEAFTAGRWRAASAWYERADELLRDRCAGVAWELVTTQLMASWVRYYRGQIDALSRTMPVVLRGAEQRGDRYAVAIFSAQAAWVALAADDVAGARGAIAGALSRWTTSGFHLEHFVGLLGETHVDRYAGRAGVAWKRLTASWPALEGSMLLMMQNSRVMAHVERASTALGAAEGAADPEPLIQSALRDAAALAREKTPWSDPFVPLIRAGASALRGDRDAAIAQLEASAAGFDAADMPLYAAAARRQAGELLGGEKGLQRLLVADAVMARERIKSPARWAAMLAPGFGRR
ncbi:ATP-binding protein [Sorangium sp. So ce513]|uniref:ATP-binding protein n=1 Tax=Sorangium sp. So ce513 TaxID=3133315 RepID=UPI003F606CF0